MTDREAHIAACISVFDEDAKVWRDTRCDDTPRLVYADWLWENGEPERAEFVRVQCELARLYPNWHGLPGKLFDGGLYAELRRRERELKEKNIGAWTDFLPESIVTEECPSCADQAPDYETNVVECRRCDSTGVVFTEDNIEFSRGFISHIRCSWQDWLRVESRLVWVPGGTVECPWCGGDGIHSSSYSANPCTHCFDGERSSGRIPRPFYESMQPVTDVELTGWPESSRFDVTTETTWLETREGHRFDREKCPKCGGRGFVKAETLNLVAEHCPDCHGRQLNSWTCESWPMQKFVMPEPAARDSAAAARGLSERTMRRMEAAADNS